MAATAKDVKKLAALARIKVTGAEIEKFTNEFDAILDYVGQLEKLNIPRNLGKEKPPLRNVMREDGAPHASCAYTGKLTEQFPARLPAQAGEGEHLVVKQIISYE